MAAMSETNHTPHEEAPWNEPLDELERELMAPESWDESTATVYGPATRHGIRLELRLAGEDLRTINAAADKDEVPLSRYILQAALEKAKRAQNISSAHDTTKGAA
jgi:hypothetical protein